VGIKPNCLIFERKAIGGRQRDQRPSKVKGRKDKLLVVRFVGARGKEIRETAKAKIKRITVFLANGG